MHVSHGLKRRYWSHGKLNDMLFNAGIDVVKARVVELSDDDWNELGDWLYYKIHQGEKDTVKDRREPVAILERIRRRT